MAVIKCKMCGGDLVIEPGATVAECEYCGTKQTIPNQDDEKKLTLFARANRLRMGCEFDKAAGIYESIVADFPQEAEAYWGLVLCKYGIEYVDDPATGKKIPTCHRSSFESIMEDSDFEQALENADVVARKVYRDEAKQIEEIRKGIIEVSGKEEPYDIFICYKETDENGQRTVDSVIAQDVYDALTEKGYRVFFSRITLEDKLGQEYEPYIFAALNSAKIMLAFGTDYEYYNAVWVKNEWSRYLKLMARDKTKHLIPCYKGIDAYDMPKEFAKLQAQDMGKVGAIQDLMRGIEKLLPRTDSSAPVQQVVQQVVAPADNRQSAQLDRGYMALEDGDWKKADGFFEEALNLDAHSAPAYIGKALAQEKCQNLHALVLKKLAECQEVEAENKTIQPEKAQLAHVEEAAQKYSVPGYFEPEEVKALYKYDFSYPSYISGREKQLEEQSQWWTNHRFLSRAEQFATGDTAEKLQTEKKWLIDTLTQRIKDAEKAEQEAIQTLRQNYEQFLSETDAKVEQESQNWAKEREKEYQEWYTKAQTEHNTYLLKQLASQFDRLGDYQDSKAMAEFCRNQVKEEEERNKAEQERQSRIYVQRQKRSAKRKKIAWITLAVLAIAGCFLIMMVILPARYKQAESLLESGRYTDAAAAFEALGNYKDSRTRADESQKEAQYVQATMLYENGRYTDAAAAFEALGNYEDSSTRAKEAQYVQANTLYENGQYMEAAVSFARLTGYRDAQQRSQELWNTIAVRETVCAGDAHTIGLKSDGTVVAVGYNYCGRCDVSGWRDIVAVSAGGSYTVGLKSDGTVVAVGDNFYGQCDVSDWRDIVAVSASSAHTVGLKSDGTVVAIGDDWGWEKCDVSDWRDIVAVSAGGAHTVGLKTDGTVVAVGNNGGGECDVSDWRDIVAVSARSAHTVGLKSDGTVVVAGDNFYGKYGRCDVSDWRDIVAVSAGSQHIVGLKSDGTVVAVGDNYGGKCDVSDWRDIVAVSAGSQHTVGLKTDGTVVAVGDRSWERCNVSSWQDIRLPAKNQN